MRLVARLRALVGAYRRRRQIPRGATIGTDVFIGSRARLDWRHGMHITILDGATIVDGSRILCHDASSYRRIGATWVAPVVIGRRAFVGADSIVMPGVTVGDDAIIAAGAVVTQDVPAGVVVAGIPARAVGLTADVDARRASMMGERPCFDESVYNRADLDPDRLTELHDAASEGGYFLVRPAQDDRMQ